MKTTIKALSILIGLLLAGCTTKDFTVVDTLHIGMTKEEATATITSFAFQREKALYRPTSGWLSDNTFTDLPGRARLIEEQSKKKISSAEYYPVGHGLMGFAQLYLFYDENGLLADFYRRQIN